MSKNKAITFDGTIDSFFRNCQKVHLINDWWNEKVIQGLGYKIFEARLIPLNKKWPNIPKEDEFRPIIVLSAAYKWLELRFLKKLKEYLVTRLDINQTGFVPGCTTHLNIVHLIEHVKTFKKKDA